MFHDKQHNFLSSKSITLQKINKQMDFEVVVIGAGVVGLAIGAELSNTINGVVVVEKHKKFGQETSSRNSEVVHSGIYYPKGSLKAHLCVEGQKLLYERCEKHEIPYKRCGKFIIAKNNEEISYLKNLLKKAAENGAKGQLLTSDEVKSFEPNIECVAGLYFANSGIIDSHGLMKSFETEIIINGAEVVYNSEVTGIKRIDNGYEITVTDAEGNFSFTSRAVVNSAGLFADKISAMIGLDLPEYEIFFWKGEYFAVGNGKNKLVKSLIYPVPNKNIGLGIHGTVDLNGGLKLGPNGFRISKNNYDYKVNGEHLQEFYTSAKYFLPFLEIEDLHPDQAGIRPKLTATGENFRDFIIVNEEDKGFPNFINLIGIESPGLTASAAISKYVKSILKL